MAATKTARSLIAASTALAVSSSVSSTEWNLSTAYGGLLNFRFTNGASAPTVAPTVIVYTGGATTVKRQFFSAAGNTTASSVVDIPVQIPASAMYVNVTASLGAATNGVTIECSGQELTTI